MGSMSNPIGTLVVIGLLGGCKLPASGDDSMPVEPVEEAPAEESVEVEKAPVAEEPAEKAETAVVEPVPEAKAWQRSGEQPGMSKIRQTCKDEGIADPEMAGKPQDLEDGRFLSVVFDKQEETTWVLAVSDWEGSTQLEGKVQLDIPDLFTGLGITIAVPARKKGDFDGDGELEAWLIVRYETEPEPAVGGSTRQEFFVLDLDPELVVAFQVTSKISPEADMAATLGGKVGFEDSDGDGHGDVVFKGKECMDEPDGEDWKEVCETFENVWLWNEKKDVWK